jgi:predicted PurR-regulated permease PerM
MAQEGNARKPARPAMDRVFALIPVALFILFFYLLYRIFAPFLGSIAWALILGILFMPLHRRLLTRLKSRRTLSAFLMTILVILVIVIPAGFLSVVLARQAAHGISLVADAIGGLDGGSGTDSQPLLSRLQLWVSHYVDLDQVDAQGAILEALRKLSKRALNSSTTILQNVARMIFSLFIMLFTLYYVFKDGGSAARYVESIHPMIRQTRLFRTLEELTFTTFYAGFVVAAVQGFLAGVAFAVLGVPSAFFWGAMTALMSFVPLVGATSIWLPIVIWFAVSGAWGKAIGLALWGAGVVSVADNLIKPALISGRMNLHPLLVFFSVLGGLGLFGPLGVVLGPLVLVLCLGLLDVLMARPAGAGD